jgi:hypothetical protein
VADALKIPSSPSMHAADDNCSFGGHRRAAAAAAAASSSSSSSSSSYGGGGCRRQAVKLPILALPCMPPTLIAHLAAIEELPLLLLRLLLLMEEEGADDKLLSADIDSYKRTTKCKTRQLLQHDLLGCCHPRLHPAVDPAYHSNQTQY